MSEKKRLFLLDAYALIFRGYYAFIKNPRINSKGMNTSAIMGFMNSLLDVIKREKPDHLAVCFDKGGSQERTGMFTEYKANRDETPEAIVISVPYIQKILEAMHIPVVVKKGFEADDIIASYTKAAVAAGSEVITPLLVLLTPGVFECPLVLAEVRVVQSFHVLRAFCKEFIAFCVFNYHSNRSTNNVI